jgi:hypothetical protein
MSDYGKVITFQKLKAERLKEETMKTRKMVEYLVFLTQWLIAVPAVYTVCFSFISVVFVTACIAYPVSILKELYKQRKGIIEFVLNVETYL